MHVGICDDRREARDFLREILRECAEVRSVLEFSEGDALLEAMEGGVVFDLVFMDIDMPGKIRIFNKANGMHAFHWPHWMRASPCGRLPGSAPADPRGIAAPESSARGSSRGRAAAIAA